MIFNIPEFDDDEPDFLACVDLMIHSVVDKYQPSKYQIFRINNWFGPRWLGFCGKLLGAVGFRNYTNIVVPPFVQHRLTAQSLFVRGASGEYDYAGQGPQVHHIGESSRNFKNLVRDRAPDTALFWFSGRTSVNERGSVMTYFPTPEYVLCHLQLARTDRWWPVHEEIIPESAIDFSRQFGVKHWIDALGPSR